MSECPTPTKSWHEVLVALTPLILGICITGVGALFTQIYNYRQLQLNQLDALDKFRPLLVSENPLDREFAYASFAALGYEDLAVRLISVKQDSAGRAVVQEIKTSGSSETKAAASAALARLPAQVYLQIDTEAQRGKAKVLTAALQQSGFQPQGIENIAGKATSPKANEVRYFREEDKSAAEAIARTLGEQGVKDVRVRLIGFLKARPGSIEVWLAGEGN
ncbi:MAG: hypothetical protein HGA75_14830 [Thiobacillus sp.]|nr:hypothetical protein [Thiobacillus sp.]